MKEFDLEAAKAGAAVQTRDGKKARIICFDVMDIGYPIIALVTNKNYGILHEETYTYTKQEHLYGHSKEEHPLDLVMAPIKKEGWINIYPPHKVLTLASVGKDIYKTETEAKINASEGVICQAKVEWEE